MNELSCSNNPQSLFRKYAKLVTCNYCGKEIYRSLSVIKKNKKNYCSYPHFALGNIPYNKGKSKYTPQEKKCLCGCGKKIVSPDKKGRARQFFVGHSLYKPTTSWCKGKKLSEDHKKKLSEAHKGKIAWNKGKKSIQTGSKHWNWKGGIWPRSNKTVEYKTWRQAVYERDNYTCVSCGGGNGILEANHIFPWAKYPQSRFEVNNGITLCNSCHLILRKHEEDYAPFFQEIVRSYNYAN